MTILANLNCDFETKRFLVFSATGFGQLVGVAALVLMGILEVVRKADMSVHGGFNQNVGGTDYNASYVSLFWQTPQFVLSGVAEAFTSVSGLCWIGRR